MFYHNKQKKKYQLHDFKDDNTWVIFRMDMFVDKQIVDVYAILTLPEDMIVGHEIAITELSEEQVDKLLKSALFQYGEIPKQILLAHNDPIEPLLLEWANDLQVKINTVPAISLEDLTDPVKESFRSKFSGLAPKRDRTEDEEIDYENAKRSIPDSYDLCPCASGLKYKYCCKRIFREITEAMVAVEEGYYKEALGWIAKARAKVGNTAEVYCRESIVYSFFDTQKSEECLQKCLEVNPKHPRAFYLQGLNLLGQGDFYGAVIAYKKAISYYPATDHYHLNEVHNNLGTLYYRMGNLALAKSELETALRYLPTDKMTQRNLQDFFPNR